MALRSGVVVERGDVIDVAGASGTSAPREEAGLVAKDHLFAESIRDRASRRLDFSAEVDHWPDADTGVRLAAPPLDLLEQHQTLPGFEAAGGRDRQFVACSGGVEVQMEDNLPRGGERRVGHRAVATKSQRRLLPSQVAQGRGPAGVERSGRSERGQGRGTVAERAIEVEGRGDVEFGLEVHGAGKVHLVTVQRRVAWVDVAPTARVQRNFFSEVMASDGLGDEPVELGGPDLAGDCRNLRIDPSGGLAGQGRGSVDGGFGD